MEFTPEQLTIMIEFIRRATHSLHKGKVNAVVPDGYELTGEVRHSTPNDLVFFYNIELNKFVVEKAGNYLSSIHMIARKIKKYEWATDNKPRVPVIGDIVRDTCSGQMVEVSADNISIYANRPYSARLCYRRIEVD